MTRDVSADTLHYCHIQWTILFSNVPVVQVVQQNVAAAAPSPAFPLWPPPANLSRERTACREGRTTRYLPVPISSSWFASLQQSLSAPSGFASMSQPVSESLAILSASVVPALEATSNVAAKVSIASSEYVAARHRLDAVLNDAAQIRGQKRAAALEILSNKRSLGADLVESSLAADAAQASSAAATSLSVSEVCDGIVQVWPYFSSRFDHSPLTKPPGALCCQSGGHAAGRSPHRVLGQQARYWRSRLHGASF